MDQPGVVIVGAGHAGFTAAAALRQKGYTEAVTLVTAEDDLPYQRPPLSKGYLAGDIGGQRLAFRPADFYERTRIGLRRGDPAEWIDREAKALLLSSGQSLRYDHLVLATGSTPRTAVLPGADLDGVFRLHSRADADALRERLAAAHDMVIVGGGFIGLELAAHARGQDKDVTVVESTDRLLGRAVSPVTSAFFHDTHLSWGCRVLLGSPVAGLVGDETGRVRGVRLQEGSVLDADLVVIGVGARANTELAERSGLSVDNGVVVDAGLRTSDPHVHAIGDCARYPSGCRTVRYECVENAVGQARTVAEELTTGRPQNYRRVPSFWSDQRDLKLQIAGDSTGHDRVVLLGDPAEGSFSVQCFHGATLVAVESVNRPSDHVSARQQLKPT
ncbi:FAD-dependent oxidoreductase [Streptomyces sp. NBC_01537]|uniref:NAD(P)/FAD-dependent oxidoreductase n=1 Tax=Streptomyces sp. NBC_01537 TaxID=2903896 RepID=UPI003864B400